MKHTKVRISLLVGTAFLTAFIIILLIFNVLMHNHTKNGASEAINQYFDNTLTGSWEQKFSTYFASGIYLEKTSDNAYFSDQYSDEPDLPYKNNLIKWLSENKVEQNQIVQAKIADRIYYLALRPIHDDNWYMMAVYVDVTAETILVHKINILIFFVMVLCSIFACTAGIFMGKRMEQEQRQQKKIFENASHQLKTPLMVIQGYAEGLAYGIVQDEKQTAEIIMTETEKMACFIDEILNLSRIESNDIKFSFEPLSMKTFLNNCLADIEFLAVKRGIRVETDILDDVVKADSLQLERAVNNILSNAVKYADSLIKISYHEKKLIIWNDGSGIAMEDLDHIFKRFYIGKTGNTGIGLALTKEVIERHGWKIYAENTTNGIQFVIKTK